MKKLTINTDRLTIGASYSNEVLHLARSGAGILLPELIDCSERYLTFRVRILEEHSLAFHLRFSDKDSGDEPAFFVRFGVLPGVDTQIAIDLQWLDAHILFPEAVPGSLKMVCHGRRVDRSELLRVDLQALPCHHDITLELRDICLTDEYPEFKPVPGLRLVDEWGQSLHKDWPGKIRTAQDMKDALNDAEREAEETVFPDLDRWGGWKSMPLTEATGWFTKSKKNGRWYLVDPDGNAFFSQGPDGVNAALDCRVDGVEPYMTWLPDRSDPAYAAMFREMPRRSEEYRRKAIMFSFPRANLYRAWGDGWESKWRNYVVKVLKGMGLNTLANWSDPALYGTTGMPYVTSLPRFPRTEKMIFRDFPDVLSPEYEADARICAEGLSPRKDDPYMIGYFLRNEPSWAFVDNLILADEVLRTGEDTFCRRALIADLRQKYGTIEKLNAEWNCGLKGWEELETPIGKASGFSHAAERDLREFSRKLLNAYVEIPAEACRTVDPHHMILGMRWAWISDPDLVTGWNHFDVFSINCYAVDPTPAIENAVRLGVDLPIMIGEFHFGALDAGPSATGLEGVRTQKDRGTAYRYYCEKVAAHPNGVGCHFFQCYDQFALGRFDGENYNIGLLDITSRPYPEMRKAIRLCSEELPGVRSGQTPPTEDMPESIPMIAY